MNRKIWRKGNTHVIVLTKTERPEVMCSRKYEKNEEREQRHKNGVIKTWPNGNEVKVKMPPGMPSI